jgi:hypothetical protein
MAMVAMITMTMEMITKLKSTKTLKSGCSLVAEKGVRTKCSNLILRADAQARVMCGGQSIAFDHQGENSLLHARRELNNTSLFNSKHGGGTSCMQI